MEQLEHTLKHLKLIEQVKQKLLSLQVEQIFVGYSGGIDSHVLLHICAQIPEFKNRLLAVYVHHGLQTIADDWAMHCQATAQQLGVKFMMLSVNATAAKGQSPEEAARNARYSALQSLMTANTALLIAQHREDQLETVLLQLFRGCGLKGLSGMPEQMLFGQGILLRPLLHVAKHTIENYAVDHQLHWVEDPTNNTNHFDRNFLRLDVLPLLKQRWPALDKTVARSAQHCADAVLQLDKLAAQWFLLVFDNDTKTLQISKLRAFAIEEQHYIIRSWFDVLGLRMPTKNAIERILNEVVIADEDRQPELQVQDVLIRRYQDRLYCLQKKMVLCPSTLIWPKQTDILSINTTQYLQINAAHSGITAEKWRHAKKIEVRFRQGGEKIRLPGRNGTHTLKKLFQENHIPPWQRELIPLIYLDNQLAAVGEHWISADVYTDGGNALQISFKNTITEAK